MTPPLILFALAALLLSAVSSEAQYVPWYPPPAVTFLEVGDERYPNDLLVLDVLIRTPDRLRLFRTSNGSSTLSQSAPGKLIGVDIVVPVPLVSGLDGFDGFGWPQGPSSWQLLAPVANWNVIFGPTDPGKGNSQQGLSSLNGTMYVGVRQYSAETENAPRWNGLARVSGTATPQRAFAGAGGELYSTAIPHQAAGPEGSVVATSAIGDSFEFVCNYDGADAAGMLHVQLITDQANVDPAEAVDVDIFDFLGAYTSTAQLLGEYGEEVPRHWFDGPGTSASPGDKLRAASILVVADEPGSFPNAGRTFLVLAQDLDPVWPPKLETLVDVDASQLGIQPMDINYDYIPLDGSSWRDGPAGTRDDGKYDYVSFTDITGLYAGELNGSGGTVGGGGEVDAWVYTDVDAWRDHTTFLRLPADFLPDDAPSHLFPCNQEDWVNFGAPVPCPPPQPGCGSDLDFGRDWSAPAGCALTNIGSGTVFSTVPHPEGTFLYVLTGDEDVDTYFETQPPTDPNGPDEVIPDRDGGWQMPHLFVLDLSQVDLRDQASLDYNSSYFQPDGTTPNPDGFAPDWLKARRLHKMFVARTFCYILPAGVTAWGFLPFFAPTASSLDLERWVSWSDGFGGQQIPPVPPDYGTGYTAANTAQLPDPGVQSSFEHFYEPTPRTRMVAVRNDDFAGNKNRLYIGMNGWIMDSIGLVDDQECVPSPDLYQLRYNAGIVQSFMLPEGHNSFGGSTAVSGLPVVRGPILLPFKDDQGPFLKLRTFTVAGMAVLPVTDEVIELPDDPLGVSTKRIILGVLGRDRHDVFALPQSFAPENRIFLCEDP